MEFTFKSISLGHIIKTVYLFLITYSNSSKFSYPNSIKTWRLCFLSSLVLNLGIMGRRRMILSLMFGMSVEPDKVVDNLPVGLTCVGLINGRIHVLDVDDKGVNVWGDFLQVMARYV